MDNRNFEITFLNPNCHNIIIASTFSGFFTNRLSAKNNRSLINLNHLSIEVRNMGLWVGIGCKRGTSWQLIDLAIEKVFEENQLCQIAIAGIATIDTKVSEVGLVEFCNLRNLPLKAFSAEVLCRVWVPNPSTITNQEVGTPSVAEAAAIVAATQLNFLFTDYLPISAEKLQVKLLVTKQIFQLKGQPGAVTLAVAQPALFE